MTRQTVIILLVAVLFGCVFWIADSIYEYFWFQQNLRFMLFQEPMAFWDSLIANPPPHALVNRVAFMVVCLIGGGLVAFYVHRIRQAGRALRSSEALYRTYIEECPDGILVMDAGRTIVTVNKAICEMTGYRRDELVGRPALVLGADEDTQSNKAHYQSLLRDGTLGIETHMKRADGTTFPVAVESVGLPDGMHLSYCRDLTHRRHLEEQLLQSQKMEAVGQLAGGVAHDFNNLLTAILGYVDILKRSIEPDGRAAAAAGTIEKAAGQAAELTQQLLGFARKGKSRAIPLNVTEVLGDVLNLAGRTFEKSITLDRQFDPHQQLWTRGDPAQLQQVLLNLVINARDAMPEGGTLTISVDHTEIAETDAPTERRLEPGQYLVVSVTDTGCGMSQQIQQRVFEPFFTTKEPGRGTGMGLAMVYGIVANHGGLVTVYSEEGLGSTFKVYLPEVPLEGIVPEEGRTSEPIRGSGHLLVVDDETVVRQVACSMLEDLGYTTTGMGSSTEALEHFRTHHDRIDGVLLDLIMPELDGMELFERMKEVDPEVRAVLTTGYDLKGRLHEVFDRGMQGLVSKPFDLRQLSTAIHRALTGKPDPKH